MDVFKKVQAWLPVGFITGVAVSIMAWLASQLPSLVITLSTVDVNVRNQITSGGVTVPYATGYAQNIVAKYLFGLTILQHKLDWFAPVIMSILASVILVSVGVAAYSFLKFPKAKSPTQRVWFVLLWAAVATMGLAYAIGGTIPTLNFIAALVIYYFIIAFVVGLIATNVMKKSIPE